MELDEICRAIPMNMSGLLASHSTLAGVVGGFSLTCAVMIFSFNRGALAASAKDQRIDGLENATLCLLASALASLYASYMYSASGSSICIVAEYEPIIAGLSLTLGAMLLVTGIGVIAAATMGSEQPTMFGWALAAYRVSLVVLVWLFANRARVDASYAAGFTRALSRWNLLSWSDVTPGLVERARTLPGPGTSGERLGRAIFRSATEQVDNSFFNWPSLLLLVIVAAASAVPIVDRFFVGRRSRLKSRLASIRGTVPVFILPATIVVLLWSIVLVSRSMFGESGSVVSRWQLIPLVVATAGIPALAILGYWHVDLQPDASQTSAAQGRATNDGSVDVREREERRAVLR